MAHELDISNNKANMAYVGETPWHGMGQLLTEDADIETWRVQVGLNFEVVPTAVQYETDLKQTLVMADRKLLYRSDTKAALSVVSSKFKIVQPGEMLEFYRDLVATAGFKLETAGSLFGGRKFWALARCGESLRLMGQDEIKPYLLLASACDGSMATCAHFTTVRVVCNNTLRMAIGSLGQKAQVRVPHSAVFDAETVKADLGVVEDLWGEFATSATKLAKLKAHRDDAIDLVAAALKKEWHTEIGQQMTQDEMLVESQPLARIIRLFDGEGMGAVFKSSKGTAWGLLNAMTQFYDHEAGSKTGDRSRTFERAHLTDRAIFKQKFAGELLKFAA